MSGLGDSINRNIERVRRSGYYRHDGMSPSIQPIRPAPAPQAARSNSVYVAEGGVMHALPAQEAAARVASGKAVQNFATKAVTWLKNEL